MRTIAGWRGARAAVVFLTRLPIGGFPFTTEEAAWASAWFPAVGAAIGVALAGVWQVSRWLDPFPAAALTLAVGTLLTGALHEDGLADTADALGGATSRDDVLRILKDSRIGSYGGLALVIAFLLRAGLLAAMPRRAAMALIVSQCGSRVVPVWLLGALPYVTPTSDSKSRAVARASTPQAAIAGCWLLGLLAVVVFLGSVSLPRALGVVAVVIGVAWGCGRWFRERMNGVTGDLLGASQQIAEIAVLVTLALHAAE